MKAPGISELQPGTQDPIEAGMNRVLMERIPVTAFALALIFFSYAALDLAVLPRSISHIAATVAFLVAIAYTAVWRLTAAKQIPSRNANPLVAEIGRASCRERV